MRATNDLQTTITVSPVNSHHQAFSLELTLRMSLPMPQQDEHLPDQIKADVHQAGIEVQRQYFRVLIEKADQELVLQQRQGKGGAGVQRRGHAPSPLRQPSAKSPLSGRGSATTKTARSRSRRRPPGRFCLRRATTWSRTGRTWAAGVVVWQGVGRRHAQGFAGTGGPRRESCRGCNRSVWQPRCPRGHR